MPARTARATATSPGPIPDDGLPEGWIFVPLPEVVEINPGKPPADAVGPSTPVTFVPMAAVDEHSGTIATPQLRPFSSVRNGYTAFQNGDVILAKITPCMENGKAAIARDLAGGFGFGSTEFHVFRSDGAILPEYLYHYIRQESFRRAAESEMTGTVGQKRLPRDFLEDIEIPLAPLAEQRRIGAGLDELLAKLGSCSGRLESILMIVQRFRRAVLRAACSGQLTIEWRAEKDGFEDWPTFQLVELGEVTGGITKNAKRLGLKLQVPYLRVANVYTNRLDLTQVSKIGVTEHEMARTRLQRGDVLFVEGNGSVDQIGRVALWDGSIEPCVHQNHLIKFRAGKRVIPEYVLLQMMAPQGREQLMDKATSSAGLNTLSISKISEVCLPVPSVEEQRELVRRVAALFALAARIEAQVGTAGTKIAALRPSVQRKAFRGELVPKEAELAAAEGRAYESAAKLLERISAERQAHANGSGKVSPGSGRTRATPPRRGSKFA